MERRDCGLQENLNTDGKEVKVGDKIIALREYGLFERTIAVRKLC